MQSNNVVNLIGRITADPELKTTKGGTEVCTFTLAVQRPRDKNGETKTDFILCEAWRQTAVLLERYVRKGQLLSLVGTLHSENYKDSSGKNRTAYKISVENVGFLGGDRR